MGLQKNKTDIIFDNPSLDMMPGIAIVCIESVIDLHHYTSEIPTWLISTSIQSNFSVSVEKHSV